MIDALQDISNHADICDASDVVIPVVGGHTTAEAARELEPGAGMYSIPELTHADPNELYPVYSNGVLQRFVKGIVDARREAAKTKGVDPRRLPQDERQAKRMGVPAELITPAWMTDRTLVTSMEKYIRESAIEHLGDLRDLHHGEEECGRIATQLFLETGWNPISSSRAMPRSVKESSELSRLVSQFERAQERVGTPSPRQLAAAGLLSEHLVFNGSEDTCTYTAPWISVQGFDSVPALGLYGEDLDDIQGIIEHKLAGTDFSEVLTNSEAQWRSNWTPKHPKKLVDIAERIWHRMVELDGVHVGMTRPKMPQPRIEGQYMDHGKEYGAYKTLGTGLVIPA